VKKEKKDVPVVAGPAKKEGKKESKKAGKKQEVVAAEEKVE